MSADPQSRANVHPGTMMQPPILAAALHRAQRAAGHADATAHAIQAEQGKELSEPGLDMLLFILCAYVCFLDFGACIPQ